MSACMRISMPLLFRSSLAITYTSCNWTPGWKSRRGLSEGREGRGRRKTRRGARQRRLGKGPPSFLMLKYRHSSLDSHPLSRVVNTTGRALR